MHEVGLCEGIVAALEHRAAGRRVLSARVRVGEELRVATAALDQAFALLTEGTAVSEARLEVVTVAGDELTLESIEVAADDRRQREEEAHVPRHPG